MTSVSAIPYISSANSVDVECLNNGRVLILKNALFNPATNKYHDITLKKNGWKFLGIDFGGGGKFTGIDAEVARQIQETYGIVLKTLKSGPGGAKFWGDAKKTSYIAVPEGRKRSSWSWMNSVKESYPFGQKRDDVILAPEDAARFGASQMTVHDAVNAGIWNASGWLKAMPSSLEQPAAQELSHIGPIPAGLRREKKNPFREGTEQGVPRRARKKKAVSSPQENASDIRRSKTDLGRRESPANKRRGSVDPVQDSDFERSAKTGAVRRESPANKRRGSVDPVRDNSFDRVANREPLHPDSPETRLNRKNDPSLDGELNRKSLFKRDPYFEGREALAHKDAFSRNNRARVHAGFGPPIQKLPSIPVYKAKETPVFIGFDDAPFDERMRRIIEHLDRSGPIPFSAFVDNNSERRIDRALFRRLQDALRRLAVDPSASDADAKYMKKLLTHWFRAGYHYHDKNSKPGDGYPLLLSQVRDPKTAKELYWRRHATAFWMTLVDLFATERIGIDRLLQAVSSKTSLNPWFY